ncbi:MAG: hypothetical protein QOF90_1657, partial [Acetobacteraceae bacterium]|nr:hypothetical protein [Acetobacteraceae bacterium]
MEIQQQPDADRLMRGSQNLRFVCREKAATPLISSINITVSATRYRPGTR